MHIKTKAGDSKYPGKNIKLIKTLLGIDPQCRGKFVTKQDHSQ